MSDIATTDLTADEARALTADIRRDLDGLLPKIKRAFEGRADRALGYESWQSYCAAELGDVRVPLGDRPTAVAELRGAGMSTRAIGSALGISNATVSRDLSTVTDVTVDQPERIASLDGRERPATRPAAAPDEVRQAVEDVTDPGLKPDVVRLLTHAGAVGLTVVQLQRAWVGDVPQVALQDALFALSDAGHVVVAGHTDAGMALWALTELIATPEDLPASPGEGRSAGLPLAVGPADASDGGVATDVAADKLPAGPDPAVAAVAAALDQFVPDPYAGHMAWRKDLHERLGPVHRFTTWIGVDDAAEFASADDVETIRQLALSFADLHRRIVAARNGNVVPLRAVR